MNLVNVTCLICAAHVPYKLQDGRCAATVQQHPAAGGSGAYTQHESLRLWLKLANRIFPRKVLRPSQNASNKLEWADAVGIVAPRHVDRANLRPVTQRTLYNGGLRRALIPSTALTLEVHNITDNQVADLWGYPLPGRSYSMTLNHAFIRL